MGRNRSVALDQQTKTTTSNKTFNKTFTKLSTNTEYFSKYDR